MSHTFLVAEDAWRPAVGVLARGLYHQRSGYTIDPQYLAPWTRRMTCDAADGVPETSPPPAGRYGAEHCRAGQGMQGQGGGARWKAHTIYGAGQG